MKQMTTRLRLVHNLLQFTRYRAADVVNLVSEDEEDTLINLVSEDEDARPPASPPPNPNPASPTGFMTKVEVPKNGILSKPYPWLKGNDVSNGMERAIRDAEERDRSITDQVYFMDQFMYGENKDSNEFLKHNVHALSARTRGLDLRHRFLVWYVNMTAMESGASLSGAARGIHWCVILVDFVPPEDIVRAMKAGSESGHANRAEIEEFKQLEKFENLSVGFTHKTYPKISVRVRYFDPMGGQMPENLTQAMTNFLNTSIVGALMQKNEAFAPLTQDESMPTMEIDFQNIVKEKIQQDGRQCGVYCIWMLHQFMLSGSVDNTTWPRPPSPQTKPENQKIFREWYFTERDGKRKDRGESSRSAQF